MSNSHREEQVDLTGEVTMVCVNRPRMAMQLSGGQEIETAFRAEDEDIVTTALKQHKTVKLRLIGRGQLDANGRIERITEVTETILLPNGQGTNDVPAKSIWERFAEIASDIPDAELQRLPKDGSVNLDDYLYGTAKDD